MPDSGSPNQCRPRPEMWPACRETRGRAEQSSCPRRSHSMKCFCTRLGSHRPPRWSSYSRRHPPPVARRSPGLRFCLHSNQSSMRWSAGSCSGYPVTGFPQSEPENDELPLRDHKAVANSQLTTVVLDLTERPIDFFLVIFLVTPTAQAPLLEELGLPRNQVFVKPSILFGIYSRRDITYPSPLAVQHLASNQLLHCAVPLPSARGCWSFQQLPVQCNSLALAL